MEDSEKNIEEKKETEKIIKQRREKIKEKIRNWLKDPHNLTLLGILIFAFVIRLYYFILTKNQPLWYDEAEYMSGGVHWAFEVPFKFSPQRQVLFHFLISVLLRLSFNELSIKFILSILPSFLIVLFSYLLVKEMYDKRTALITSFAMAVFWMSLFYSMRIMTDLISLFFGFLMFYFFWKGYVKEQSKYYLWAMGFLIPLAFLVRLIGILFGLSIFLFLLFTERFKIFKNKNLWIAFLIAILTTAPFLIWYYSYHGNLFGFIGSNVGTGQAGSKALPIAWHLLNFVPVYLKTGFLIMFFIGLLTTLNLFISLDLFFKNKDKRFYADFFNMLSLIFVLSFFIFYFKIAEDRWMISMTIPLFIFASKGVLFVYEKIKSNLNKSLAVIFLLLILIYGAYSHLTFADQLIKIKKDSYSQVRQAGLWIKENSEKGDIVFSNSITQNTYYSQRETIAFGENETEFLEKIKEINPRYLAVSAFENHPPWLLTPSESFRNITNPVKAFFFDAEQKQLALVIYEYNKRAINFNSSLYR